MYAMKPPPRRLSTVAVSLLATVAATGQESPRPVIAPLADSIPALEQQSVWQLDAEWTGADPDHVRRGVYPVGNGRVFTHIGLGARANTMLGLTGPHYRVPGDDGFDGHFGGLTLELVGEANRPVGLEELRVRRVLDANFVVTEDRSRTGLALRTLTFAPPRSTAILRVVDVVNESGTAISGLGLAAVPDAGGTTAIGNRLLRESAPGAGAARATIALTGATPVDGRLVVPIPTIAPRGAFRAVLRVDTFDAGAAIPSNEPDTTVDGALRAASATLDAWQVALRDTTSYDTDHLRLRDLIRDWKVMVLTLRCAETGVVVPMLARRTASVRDTSGALLLLLRFKLWGEARRLLEYQYDAARSLGRIAGEVPLGLDLRELGDRQPDWDTIPIPAAEIPSWIVLQHLWYWRATHDTELIRRHHKLLLACVKRQRREVDDLMRFDGGETWLGGGLLDLAARFPADPRLVGVDATVGRHAYSLASSTLFLTAVQAIGELENAIDEHEHPEKYVDPDAAVTRPGDAWTKRVYSLMTDIERRYWLEDESMFAPAISAVDLSPFASPIANANLMPLWAGWTYPTGERSRDNLRSTLERLWRDDARIGTTPTLGYATGDLQGMLLVALSERDCARRLDVVDELLSSAEPAGEWARLHGPDGRPVAVDPSAPARLMPGESGVDLDAILFALTGIRHASVPNWDSKDIRLKLRLPHGAQFLSVRNTAKDGRRLNLFFRRTTSPLTEDERRANDELAPDKRRDPDSPHARLRFVVDLVEGRPRKGYYDVALNAEGTMFVRYLKPDAPTGEEADLRRIDEMEFCVADHLVFLPRGEHRPTPLAPRRVGGTTGARVVAVSSRPGVRDLFDAATTTFFDSAVPCTVRDLEFLLLTPDGAPAHESLYLDWNHDGGPPASFVAWSDPAWSELLARYGAAGGKILRPGFLRRFEWFDGQDWRAGTEDAGGVIAPPSGAAVAQRLRVSLETGTARECVLRFGSSCGATLRLNGQPISTRRGARPLLPDQDAHVVALKPGVNRLELELDTDGAPRALVRLTESDGTPITGLQ